MFPIKRTLNSNTDKVTRLTIVVSCRCKIKLSLKMKANLENKTPNNIHTTIKSPSCPQASVTKNAFLCVFKAIFIESYDKYIMLYMTDFSPVTYTISVLNCISAS